jgi:hypothetical protein
LIAKRRTRLAADPFLCFGRYRSTPLIAEVRQHLDSNRQRPEFHPFSNEATELVQAIG